MRQMQDDTNGGAPDLRLCLAAQELAIRAGLQQIRRWLLRARMRPDLVGRAELALAEILNNVAEHAYQASGAGQIELSCEIDSSGLRIAVRDWGCALPQDLLHKNAPQRHMTTAGDAQTLPDGGFGWHIIHQLTQDLVSQRLDGGNLLTCLVPHRSGCEKDERTADTGAST